MSVITSSQLKMLGQCGQQFLTELQGKVPPPSELAASTGCCSRPAVRAQHRCWYPQRRTTTPVIPTPSPSAGTQLRRVSTCNSAPTGTPHQNAERGCSTLITTSANRNAAVTEGTHPPVPFQWCWKQGQLLGWEHHLHFAPTSFPQVPAECNRNHHRVLCQAGHQCSSSSNIQIFDSFEKLEVWQTKKRLIKEAHH